MSGGRGPNAWNTVQVTVPANAAPLFQLGVEVATTTAGWTGTIYADSVGCSAPSRRP